MITDTLYTNRSFLYGDGFFESFRLSSGVCSRLPLHYERMKRSAGLLLMNWDPGYTIGFFQDLLKEESNAFTETELRCRLLFYRESTGTYLPDRDTMKYYLRMDPYNPLTKDTLRAGIYPLARKPVNFMSSIKTTSALLNVMAAKYMQSMGWDEIILLNEYGRVCESLSCNVFLLKDGVYYTPPISEGCVDGVNRRDFLNQHPEIIERPIGVDELKDGEIFFSNAVRGMVKGELIF